MLAYTMVSLRFTSDSVTSRDVWLSFKITGYRYRWYYNKRNVHLFKLYVTLPVFVRTFWCRPRWFLDRLAAVDVDMHAPQNAVRLPSIRTTHSHLSATCSYAFPLD